MQSIMRGAVGSVLVLGLLAVTPAAAAPPSEWLVMPVNGTHPPPADPTLLRLTKRVATAFAAVVPGAVRVAERSHRDDHCRDSGWRCPKEIADMLGAERVVSLQLSDEQDSLRVLVYGARRGLMGEVKLPCEWVEGQTVCDNRPLKGFLRRLDPPALNSQMVFDAFEALQDDLRRCLKGRRGVAAAKVSFRLHSNGHAHGARIEPRKLQRRKAYACMARVIEGLDVGPFSGPEPKPFTFALPDRPEPTSED